MSPATLPTIVITPRGLSSLAEWREIWAARDLWWFMVRRDWKTRYVQSVLGFGWAIVQPLFTMGVFTLVFGKLAGMSSDGAPYPVFSLTAVVVWTFFQAAVTETGNCLAGNLGMITKVYFPRLVLPLAGVTGKLVDLAIMLVLLGLFLAFSGSEPQIAALWAVPAALAVTMLAALAMGLWLAGLSVQYRDVRVAQSFILQLLMYASPVIYSSSRVSAWPEYWRTLYFCNPLAGVIEAMRASLLGVGTVSWRHLLQGTVVTLIGLLGGLWCFRRAEQVVADVG